MGNLHPANSEQDQDGQDLDLKNLIDFKKAIVLQLQPLTNWSLQQIRQIYIPFRQRKGSPILSRSQFLRFLRLSRITSFYIFDKMCSQHSLNVFEILSILVLTGYTSYTYKIQFLFNVFDLDGSRGLQFKELILTFKSLVRGFCILTHQNLPNNQLLDKYAFLMFSRADLNNDQCLQLGEVLSWFQGNLQGIQLFKRFEPDLIGKEPFHIFNTFQPYTQEEIRQISQRIQKQYKKIPLCQQDFLALHYELKTQRNDESKVIEQFTIPILEKVTNRNESLKKQKSKLFNVLTNRQSKRDIKVNKNKENLVSMNVIKQRKIKTLSVEEPVKLNFNIKPTSKRTQRVKFADKQNQSLSKYLGDTGRSKLQSSVLARSQRSTVQNRTKKSIQDRTQHSIKNVVLKTHLNTWQQTFLNFDQIREIKSKFSKKKFQNVIIIKGKSLTKKQIFDLRDYFEGMSCGKKHILIQNFMNAFDNEKYIHMRSIAASLFNFLDKNQNGKVTFRQFIQRLYPSLTSQNYAVIQLWNNQYNQNFNIQKKIKVNRQHQQVKVRILPKSCITRYTQIFNFFDQKKKGYVDFQDLRRVLSQVSTDKELMQTFQDNDKDKDGKLNIKEFLHVILPLDLEIEGL